jgi:hypothetical protein
MRSTSRASVLATVACLAAGVAAQSPPVQHDFYGTYAPGSPENGSSGSAGDFFDRTPGGTLTSRFTAAQLGFPTAVTNTMVHVLSHAPGNDVVGAWGPATPPVSQVNLRRTTIRYTVGSGSSVKVGGGAVAACSGSPTPPITSQIFQMEATYNTQATPAFSVSQVPFSVGCYGGTTNTDISAMSWDPGSGSEAPFFFTLSAASAQAIRNAAGPSFSDVTSTALMYKPGGTSASFVYVDLAVGSSAILQANDEIDGMIVAPEGFLAFTLTAGSPTVTGPNKMPLTPPPAGFSGTTYYANQNSIIGYTLSAAQAWATIPSPPSGMGFDTPFLWLDPWFLGLGSSNGTNHTSDDLNELQAGDPPVPDGYAGDCPLRGSSGDVAADRLHLFANGVAGDGGGVFPVHVLPYTALTVNLNLYSSSLLDGDYDWILFVNTGPVLERDITILDFSSTTGYLKFMFDPFGSTSAPVLGTYPMTYHGYTQLSWTSNYSMSIPNGLPEGDYTMQIYVERKPTISERYTTNCVQVSCRSYYNPWNL